MKKKIILVVSFILVIGLSLFIGYKLNAKKVETLPKPEVTEGERGALGIDKNINESTIDNYLNSDTAAHSIFEMNHGIEYLNDIVEFERLSEAFAKRSVFPSFQSAV